MGELKMLGSNINLKKEEHSHDLKRRADFAEGLDFIPFIGNKVGSPDADGNRVALWVTGSWNKDKHVG